jgi:hypothetical protein
MRETGLTWNSESNKFEKAKPKPKRLEANAPYVKRDEIVGGIESWVDGKIYDSKSNLRRSYKEQGVIEKGDERLPPPKPPDPEEHRKDAREDTERIYHQLKNDEIFVDEKEREWNMRENQRMRLDKRRLKTRWAR